MQDVKAFTFLNEDIEKANELTEQFKQLETRADLMEKLKKTYNDRFTPESQAAYFRAKGFDVKIRPFGRALYMSDNDVLEEKIGSVFVISSSDAEQDKSIELGLEYDRETDEMYHGLLLTKHELAKEYRDTNREALDMTQIVAGQVAEFPISSAHYYVTNTDQVYEIHCDLRSGLFVSDKVPDIEPSEFYDGRLVQQILDNMNLPQRINGNIYMVVNPVKGLKMVTLIEHLTEHISTLDERNTVLFDAKYNGMGPHQKARHRLRQFLELNQ